MTVIVSTGIDSISFSFSLCLSVSQSLSLSVFVWLVEFDVSCHSLMLFGQRWLLLDMKVTRSADIHSISLFLCLSVSLSLSLSLFFLFFFFFFFICFGRIWRFMSQPPVSWPKMIIKKDDYIGIRNLLYSFNFSLSFSLCLSVCLSLFVWLGGIWLFVSQLPVSLRMPKQITYIDQEWKRNSKAKMNMGKLRKPNCQKVKI